jgi:hypothetical protein
MSENCHPGLERELFRQEPIGGVVLGTILSVTRILLWHSPLNQSMDCLSLNNVADEIDPHCISSSQ